MNHRTYDAQRYSPLARINKDNVKNLKLAYAVPIGGTADQREPAGDAAGRGRLHVRRRPVGHRLQDRRALRRHAAASSGAWTPSRRNSRCRTAARRCGAISSSRSPTIRPRVIATDKDTGKVAWETNVADGQADLQLTAAPLAVKDKIVVGAAGGDRGVRDWIAGLDAKTGKVALEEIRGPGARRARQRDLEGQEQRLADRRRRHVGDRQLRCRSQPGDLGHRQSGADVRPDLSAGRQSLHQQRDLLESRRRQDELVLPVHAGRPRGTTTRPARTS